jgi:hypothetical protein
VLNRTLGFPGAWTGEAISAAAAFAAGKPMLLSAALGWFAYGD